MKRLRILASVGFSVLLVVLLGASVFVSQQSQDTRSKAVNDFEYMVVTPAERRKNGYAQVSTVLNKLDPKFQYRLVFNLTYEDNPQSPPSGGERPHNRKKTKKGIESKTYKYKFKARDCHYIAKLDIQLYFRESKKKWSPVNAPGTVGNTKMEIPCPSQVVVAPSPQPPTPPATDPNASASAETPPPPPPPPAEQALLPSEEGLSEADSEAEDIENLEEFSVLEQESAEAANTGGTELVSPTPAAQPSPSPIAQIPSPTPAASPSPIAKVTPSPATIASVSPTPSNQVILAPSIAPNNPPPPPPAQPAANETTGGFGVLLQKTDNPPPPPPQTQTKTVASPRPSAIAVTSILPSLLPVPASADAPKIGTSLADSFLEKKIQTIPAGSITPKKVTAAQTATVVTPEPKKNSLLYWILGGVGIVGVVGVGVILLL